MANHVVLNDCFCNNTCRYPTKSTLKSIDLVGYLSKIGDFEPIVNQIGVKSHRFSWVSPLFRLYSRRSILYPFTKKLDIFVVEDKNSFDHETDRTHLTNGIPIRQRQ